MLPATCDDRVSTSFDSAGDRDVLLERRHGQRKGDGGPLPDEQLELRNDHRGKPRELALQAVRAGLHVGEPVLASLVGERHILAAATHFGGRDGDPGQHAPGCIGDDSRNARRLLGKDVSAAPGYKYEPQGKALAQHD